MMTTVAWIVLAVIVIAIAWCLMKKCKKGSNLPQKTQGPTTPMV